MDDEELARLEHDNMIEALSIAGGLVPGARVARRDGVALIATGLPLRLFNQVLVADPDASDEAVSAAVALLRDRDDRFAVDLRAGADDRFVPLMSTLGLVAMPDGPWMPGMALHPLPGAAPEIAGHEIRRVADAAGVRDHVATAAAGFGMPVEWIDKIVTPALARRADATLYVGYADGRAVTSGLGIRTGRTIGIYNIATVEGARRRGYGAAMTLRVIADGAAAGCDVAILQASEMGLPIYERLGFRRVVEYFGYVDPASLPPPAASA